MDGRPDQYKDSDRCLSDLYVGYRLAPEQMI